MTKSKYKDKNQLGAARSRLRAAWQNIKAKSSMPRAEAENLWILGAI